MTRHVDQQGIEAIKRFEGCRLSAYQDGSGIHGGNWTIGWGSTRGVHEGMTISQAEAERRLEADLAPAEDAVTRLVQVPLDDGQFAALVSFVFNAGEGTLRRSTLLKELNAGRYAAVPAELMRFRFAGGKPLKGLATRRAAEAALWTHGAQAPLAQALSRHAPGTSGPSSAPASDPPPTTERSPSMGALTAISSIFGLVQTFGPLIPEVVAEVPDIAKRAGKLVGDVKAMDVSDSIADLEALVSAASVPFHLVTKTLEASKFMTAPTSA